MSPNGWHWMVVLKAFETLGPERVTLGLTATGHGWGDCFLSHATGGQPYGLRPSLAKGWRTSRAPGLTPDMTQAVVRVWDREEAVFRTLAAQWLDEQHAPLRVIAGSLHTANAS